MKRTALWSLLGAITLLALTASAAQAQERKIIVEGFRANEPSMSLQLNLTSLTVGDDSLDVDGVADLGGINLSWRWDLLEWGGLEVALGAYGRASDDDRVAESRSNLSIAWMWYFARHYHHRFYAVTGLASLTTEGTLLHGGSDDAGDDYTYSEFGPVLGVGSEWLISKNWLFTVDARALLLSADQDSFGEAPSTLGGPEDTAPRGPSISVPESRSALQVNLGFGYRW